jgi:hypothetical protein
MRGEVGLVRANTLLLHKRGLPIWRVFVRCVLRSLAPFLYISSREAEREAMGLSVTETRTEATHMIDKLKSSKSLYEKRLSDVFPVC